jgi:hypothetical protein
MTPDEALMHPWILEGLPPKVLAQHKKILGVRGEELLSKINKTTSTIDRNSNSNPNRSEQGDDLSKTTKISSLLM